MTNKIKGEVTFESGGQTYTFMLGTNAQVMLEKKIGLPMTKFLKKERLEEMSTEEVRAIFWAGLFRHHKLTEEAVGDLIDDVGFERLMKIFVDAVDSAKVKANGSDGEARPTKTAELPIGTTS